MTDKIAKRSVKQVKSRIRKPKGLTPDKVLAFVANKSGQTQRVIGEELGKTQRTVSKYVHEVEEYIKRSPEYKKIGPQLAAMIPDALAVYWRNLKSVPKQGSSDLLAARDIMKYAGLGKDKTGDVNVNVTITQEQRDKTLSTGLERFGLVAPAISDN